MKYNIPDRTIREICYFAEKNHIKKIILFGSRARGTNRLRSDIDIAVSGGNFDDFYWNIKEKVHSLLSFDVIDMDSDITDELKNEIEKDGVILYEKDDNFSNCLEVLKRRILNSQKMMIFTGRGL